MRFKAILPFLTCLILVSCQSSPSPIDAYRGQTMGTTYSVSIPAGQRDVAALKTSTDALLREINASMSTYISSSLISKLNADIDTSVFHQVDEHFIRVFESAKTIHHDTQGAFNPALAPLIRAWGFGVDNPVELLPAAVSSLLELTDFDKFTQANNAIKKEMPGAQLDFSAIAKGYGVDAVAELLEKEGIQDYFVEIGGEVRTKGVHPSGRVWRAGIDKPLMHTELKQYKTREIQIAIEMNNKAMATSGNYRNFYVRDGKKYVHTINPDTGYPEENDLLSASVIAEDCMTADAYATAFMVMGKDKALTLAESMPGIEAFFVTSDAEGNFVEVRTNGFPQGLSNEEI